MKLLLRLAIGAVSVWVATLLIPGITLSDESFTAPWFGTLVLVAVIFGVVNAVLQPIIKTIGCALYLLTLGLIGLVVNGALLWLTGWIAGKFNIGFTVETFWAAVFGAVVIAVVNWLLNLLLRD